MIERQPEPEEITRTYDYRLKKESMNLIALILKRSNQVKMPPNFYRGRLLKRVEEMCSGRRLIEIGGGNGALGVLATHRGWEYTNCDISEVAVTFLQRTISESKPFQSRESTTAVAAICGFSVRAWNIAKYLARLG